jgi:hypothetical protein
MYPPRVRTDDVKGMIRELTFAGVPPSGAALRRALTARFGSPGGVSRIYRLLAQERAQLKPADAVSQVEDLKRELRALREKLVRAEQREDAHQELWAQEVDRLRLKVNSLESAARGDRIAGERDLLLLHQLQAAELRAAALERRLIELTQRAGQGTG